MTSILMARPTPRGNIEEVYKWEPYIKCDKLHVKYYPEPEAYDIIYKFFMEHDYDYLVIAPDDLVVLPEDMEQLKEDCELGYDVIGGISNVNEGDYYITSCLTMDDLYHGPVWMEYDDMPKENIFKVAFNGFSLLAISRKVLKDMPFEYDNIELDGMDITGSVDTIFAINCWKRGIDIYTDKRIDMLHLRDSGRNRVGERKPRVEFVK
jgi:hypothetical protein